MKTAPTILETSATIFTAADLDFLDEIAPLDMRGAVRSALNSGAERGVEVVTAVLDGRAESARVAYFPYAHRAAVCGGGDSAWYDAASLDAAVTTGVAMLAAYSPEDDADAQA